MNIRRLDPETDSDLYAIAWGWERSYPRWLRDAEKTCGLPLPEFMAKAVTRADIGIFAPDFIGMVSVIPRGNRVFEGHIWAKRGAKIEGMAVAGGSICQGLARDLGMKAGYVWIVKRNIPIKRLCGIIGLLPDGAEIVDGESHGKSIVWQRLSLIT